MKIFTAINLVFLLNSAYGQKIDYRHIRDSVMALTCGAVDSSTVYGSFRNLMALDTNTIGKNIHQYYEDLGICYWMMSGGKNEKYLYQSIKANQSAIYHKPRSTKALWNLSFAYFQIGDCDNGKRYLTLYNKYTRKKYSDTEMEVSLLARCE